MLYVFCMECRNKKPRNKRYNAYSVVTTHGKCLRVAFAFARQPWAIRSTTLTALRGCNICNGGYIHLIIGITPIALHRYNIHNGKYIHWDIDTVCDSFIRILASIVLQNARFNAVGVALLIVQGCQTIVQATLG